MQPLQDVLSMLVNKVFFLSLTHFQMECVLTKFFFLFYNWQNQINVGCIRVAPLTHTNNWHSQINFIDELFEVGNFCTARKIVNGNKNMFSP